MEPELYKDDPLYLAIMANDKEKTAELKEKGVTLSEHIKYALTHRVGSLAVINDYSYAWWGHVLAVEKMDRERLIDVFRGLREAAGEPLYFAPSYPFDRVGQVYDKKLFSCILDCFDSRSIPKKYIWREILDKDNSELAVLALEHDWAKMPKKRDELIQYASDNNKTECLAVLLDYKNRTSNPIKEREKAEKKLQWELNANPNSVTEIKKRFGFKKQEDGTLIITSCKKGLGSGTAVIVPEKIGSYTVTAIGDYAFSGFSYASRTSVETIVFRRSITEITLPPTVKYIGSSAFERCFNLEKIHIPEGVESIGENVFFDCKKLKEISLPASLSELGHWAFSHCGIEKIIVPEKVEKVGAFNCCTDLKEIKLPKNLKAIDRYAFNRCVSLKEIEIPEGVEVLCTFSFNHCDSLEKVVLHEGLRKIEKNAFESCNSLKEIIIPEGVEEIGGLAFGSCYSLEKIYLPLSLKKAQNISVKSSPPLNIFQESPHVTAIVHKGSYAEKYCKRNNIAYELINC